MLLPFCKGADSHSDGLVLSQRILLIFFSSCCLDRVECRGCRTTTSKETPPRVLIPLAADNGKLKQNLSNSPLKTALEDGCQRV